MMQDTANPKDAAGRAKLPLHLWPATATAMGCIGLLEGMGKYGRLNWRATPVYASVYVAALKRHMEDWFEGQDLALDSQNPHLANALACLAILVDAQAHGTLIDDRQFAPTPGYQDLVAALLPQVAHLQQLHADKNPKHYDRRVPVPLKAALEPAPGKAKRRILEGARR